jgi:glutamyl-tRNA reductase
MRRDRPLFIIDLAMPRDVEPTVDQLDGVYVYDLDSVRAIAHRALETRKKEMDACDCLIEKHVCDFEGWLNPGTVSGAFRRNSSTNSAIGITWAHSSAFARNIPTSGTL